MINTQISNINSHNFAHMIFIALIKYQSFVSKNKYRKKIIYTISLVVNCHKIVKNKII